ncbi:MAG: hypothetical protein NVS1B6_19960 [Steroidobacteraceae bacterium]
MLRHLQLVSMNASPLGGRNLLQIIPYVNGQVLDNTRIGSWCVLVQRTVNLADTDLLHALGRIPQGYYCTRTSSGGVLYDASDALTSWTTTNVRLRATVAGVYDIWLW